MNFTKKKYLVSLNSEKEVSIVNFYVNWSFYSRIQKLILGKFHKCTCNKVKIYNVNSDSNKELVDQFQVRSFPSILIFKNGDMVEHLSGLQDNETLLKVLRKIL
ncbi:MAG TPA: thioredoxin family protein [Bacteroidales bacterium]|nr:thioredoxin family protein [Bacteroidales bacterium]HPS16538.1 thioredoxin family protein [Bacteroidales bacterium]